MAECPPKNPPSLKQIQNSRQNMPASKPNILTTKYEGHSGDREYVFACKGRPFCVLTAPQFPTPAFTMIDHNLVRELGLRMTDMQCVKMRYGGQNLRILGKISTSVQCIIDGAPVGNMHMKAHVVTDVYQLFNTYAIAGSKLTEKLLDKPKDDEADDTSEEQTEPTDQAKKKKRKKNKATEREKSPLASPASSSPSTPATVSNTMASLHHILATGAYNISTEYASPRFTVPRFGDGSPSPPSPLTQGRWIMRYHCVNSDDPTDFEPYWVDRRTGKEQYKEPDSWESDGSMYSYHSGDEYDDVYTNVSMFVKGATDDDSEDKQHHGQDVTTPMMVHTVGPAEARTVPYGFLVKRRMHWNRSGDEEPVPDHLRNIPIPNGTNFCNADCLWIKDLPVECGYHESYGRILSCCQRCPGAWCAHVRKSGEAFYLGSREMKEAEE